MPNPRPRRTALSPSRRQAWLVTALMAVLAGGMLVGGAGCRQAPAEADAARGQPGVQEQPSVPERPNVVLIIADDQRWDDFSFMGHPVVQTPHIDRLARESATFVNGYVPSALCRPSLATIATGRYPHQHGITGNDPPEGVPRARMLRFIARAESLPRVLRQVGYKSLQTGKWWEGHYGMGGFTHGMTINSRAANAPLPASGEGNQGRHGDFGLNIGRNTMQPIYDFVEAHEDDPFFLWYAPLLPHFPHNPPEGLLKKYQAEDRPEELAKYYAMIEWFDETVGALLGELEKQGLRENTLVFFAIDNGWIQNVDRQEGEFLFAPKSKRSPYDGGVRTPILVRWPGHVEPGRRATLASTVDIMPTVLRAAGLELPPELPGKDLVALARENAGREAVYGEDFAHDVADLSRPAASLQHRWVRVGDWKLIVPADGAPGELYNLAEDPDETNNRIDARPGVAERLSRRLNTWWQPGRSDTTDG